MKKLLLILTIFVFCSCTKDDEITAPDIDTDNPDQEVTTYTLNYDANGGAPTPLAVSGLKSGQSIILNSGSGIIKSGFFFAGWSNSLGATFAGGSSYTMGNSDVTLYSTWSSVSTYVLTYNANGGSVTPSEITGLTNNQTIILHDGVGITKSGYSLLGWTNNIGDLFETGGPYVVGGSDTILYANWNVNPIYTITFNEDGGTAPNFYTKSVTNGLTYGDLATTTKSDYIFSGWWTEVGGSGVAINFNTTVSLSANQILFAKWVVGPLFGVAKREFVTVPGGTFTQTYMNLSNFQHTISSFKISKYEVTYELWYKVRTWAITNGYYFQYTGTEGNLGFAAAVPTTNKLQPVTTINWRDSIVWCNAYSEMNSKTPIYNTTSGTILRDSRSANASACDATIPDWSASGYRLPTEGEWQYAARYKGSDQWTPYNCASGGLVGYTGTYSTDLANFSGYAWYAANSSGVKEVGTRTANQLGICDMSGNVGEFCYDWFASLPTEAQTDYRGATTGSQRVRVGGAYNNAADRLQTGDRLSITPGSVGAMYGFRVVCK